MAVAAGARRGRGEVSLAALTTEGAAARRVGCAQAAAASSCSGTPLLGILFNSE